MKAGANFRRPKWPPYTVEFGIAGREGTENLDFEIEGNGAQVGMSKKTMRSNSYD
jgi:hypothetical protein